ncbi:MAG TPA: hypothetical protein VGL92_18405 [Acidimicrobiia bacterium]
MSGRVNPPAELAGPGAPYGAGTITVGVTHACGGCAHPRVTAPSTGATSQRVPTSATTSSRVSPTPQPPTTTPSPPAPFQVPAANLAPTDPPAVTPWKNPLDANPLEGVTMTEAINETVTPSAYDPVDADN